MLKSICVTAAALLSTAVSACPYCDGQYGSSAYDQMAREAAMEEAKATFIARFKDESGSQPASTSDAASSSSSSDTASASPGAQ